MCIYIYMYIYINIHIYIYIYIYAEFRDTKFPARNGDREVTRVQSAGVIKVTFNVTTKHMKHFGYTEGKTLSTSN